MCKVQGCERWESSTEPYTATVSGGATSSTASGPGMAGLLATLRGAQRGLLVIGEVPTRDGVVAAMQIARVLGWPVACDVLSGSNL
jgi:2-succinyl-5-enolpyruvyl-6-hydroxy-3-cyclohexene-1-carboxylate synthase